jgi:hypothetical protein
LELKVAPKPLVTRNRLATVQLDADEARKNRLSRFSLGLLQTRQPKPRPPEGEIIDALAVAFVDSVVESVCGRRLVPYESEM